MTLSVKEEGEKTKRLDIERRTKDVVEEKNRFFSCRETREESASSLYARQTIGKRHDERKMRVHDKKACKKREKKTKSTSKRNRIEKGKRS